MQHSEDKRRPKGASLFGGSAKKVQDSRIAWTVVGVAVAIIVVLLFATSGRSDSGVRSKAYKKVSGAAGLHVAIQYDCGSDCQHKFDFNVYIMNNEGQQASVVRPDKDGVVQAALPEGEYILLIGKRLSKDKTFPQIPVVLKSGQQLELKLQYGGVL